MQRQKLGIIINSKIWEKEFKHKAWHNLKCMLSYHFMNSHYKYKKASWHFVFIIQMPMQGKIVFIWMQGPDVSHTAWACIHLVIVFLRESAGISASIKDRGILVQYGSVHCHGNAWNIHDNSYLMMKSGGYIDVLMQERCNFIANALLEIRLSCINPLIWWWNLVGARWHSHTSGAPFTNTDRL